ncbi:hypothetical protein BOX15_Mlig005842g1, partial [Macrostomum lignano]
LSDSDEESPNRVFRESGGPPSSVLMQLYDQIGRAGATNGGCLPLEWKRPVPARQQMQPPPQHPLMHQVDYGHGVQSAGVSSNCIGNAHNSDQVSQQQHVVVTQHGAVNIGVPITIQQKPAELASSSHQHHPAQPPRILHVIQGSQLQQLIQQSQQHQQQQIQVNLAPIGLAPVANSNRPPHSVG